MFIGRIYSTHFITNEKKHRKRLIVRAFFGSGLTDDSVDVNSVDLIGNTASDIADDSSDNYNNFSLVTHHTNT